LATIQEYRNFGVLGVSVQAEWKTAGDDRVCITCSRMEGKIYTLDEIEPMIPLHPQCRCIALPYIEELKKYE
jgi:SPP1 gp7 family putative phage head morphogenesis protein